MITKVRAAKRLLHVLEDGSDRVTRALMRAAYPARGTQLPPILLFAQPKSGSTFIHRALRRILQVPFVRIGAGGVHDAAMSYALVTKFANGNAVCREHLPARRHLLAALRHQGIRKAVLHLRDPRYSIVSWTRMIDRFANARGMAGAVLTCEMEMSDDYMSWSFDERLKWQIENYLPRQVQWIENWLALAEEDTQVELLITKYEDFSNDPAAYMRNILAFYNIAFEESWIRLPKDEIGKNNIFTTKTSDKWAGIDPALKALARDAIPESIRQRLDWEMG